MLVDSAGIRNMNIVLQTHPLPLSVDADGVIRVGGTRVTLDTVVAAFEDGLSAEEIVEAYPVLASADVYTVIGHYLRNRDEVRAYLTERARAAAEIRRTNERLFPPDGIRARLQARASRQQGPA